MAAAAAAAAVKAGDMQGHLIGAAYCIDFVLIVVAPISRLSSSMFKARFTGRSERTPVAAPKWSCYPLHRNTPHTCKCRLPAPDRSDMALCLISFLIHNLLPLSHLFGWRAINYDWVSGRVHGEAAVCCLWRQSWGKALECVATAPCIPLPYGENSARNEELRLLWCLFRRHHSVCDMALTIDELVSQ